MATPDQIIHAKAIEIGKLAVRATTAAGSGHPTTALSLAHLMAVLMYRVMRWDPERPRAGGGRSAGAVGRPCGADHLCRLRRSRRGVPARRARPRR